MVCFLKRLVVGVLGYIFVYYIGYFSLVLIIKRSFVFYLIWLIRVRYRLEEYLEFNGYVVWILLFIFGLVNIVKGVLS